TERGAKVDGLARGDHRLRHCVGLRARQTAEVDRHAEGGKLVVGDLVPGISEHELVELLGRELATVALALDQLDRSDHGSTIACPGVPRRGAFPPSQALTVAPTSANSPSSWIWPAAFRP